MDNMKNEILNLCQEALDIQQKTIKKGEWDFRCYFGGGRSFDPSVKNQYVRTIYMSRDSKRFENIPENIIDLNEIYHFYKTKHDLIDWDNYPYHNAFQNAITDLINDNKVQVLKTKDVMNGEYDAKENSSEEPTPRFIMLN